ncbi:MAG: hypothetical protein K2P78_10445 [Gemmataceae bacterium]|nr:hypothetical protein [Gemmataceae bacterium]
MPLVPNRFLVRLAHPCPLVPDVPRDADDDHLLDLPDAARLHNFADLDAQTNFADVRLAWNEFGLALQCDVKGKGEPPAGDAERPRASDGITLWVDTRDARTGHRASRYCHQFHVLAAGAGPDRDEPFVAQSKINRATQDAPLANLAEIPFRGFRTKGGYRLEAFFPAAALTGFDPAEHPRLGVYYHVRDHGLGDQFLSVNGDFPFADDPSLWAVLELVK